MDGSPFHLACRNGKAGIAEMIMKNSTRLNIDLDAKYNIIYYTAFHLACMNGQLKVAEILMKNSAEFKIELNGEDPNGQTGFHLACMNGQSKIVEMLMKNSAEFNIEWNAKEFFGQTAFHYACLHGRKNLVNLFLVEFISSHWRSTSESHKLDLTVRNKYKKTGFQLAQDRGKSDNVDLIK